MAGTLNKMIEHICKAYTQEEAAALLGVTAKSVQNYLSGENPSKKIIGKIQELYRKLKDNNWERIPMQVLSDRSEVFQITPEAVLLKVLIQEFAEYKAEKEGLDPKRVIKDIENKARIIL